MYKLFFAVLLSVLLSSCMKKMSCEYDTCTNAAPTAEIQALQSYISSNAIVATQHCSGVFYRIEAAGTGKNPSPCSNVAVKYKGMLTNGTVFDQTAGGNVAYFSLGGLIRGWRNTVPLISEGGRIVLYIPPSLGYGSQAAGTIPANSTLIFEIDLVDVE